MVLRQGSAMSKSKGNGISPQQLVSRQGADAGRVYEMFIGPPEQDVEWQDDGLQGCFRFLQRVWRLVLEPESLLGSGGGDAPDIDAVRRKTHQTARKVTEDYDGFRFNTAVSALMELANTLQDYVAGGGDRSSAYQESVGTMLKLLHPLAPHITEELWERTGGAGLMADQPWPEWSDEAAEEPEVTLVVQVNGKVRERLRVAAGLTEDQAVSAALDSERIRQALNGGRPKKIVYVPDRILSFVR
jgi:leucyl-tRNA synthetase